MIIMATIIMTITIINMMIRKQKIIEKTNKNK